MFLIRLVISVYLGKDFAGMRGLFFDSGYSDNRGYRGKIRRLDRTYFAE